MNYGSRPYGVLFVCTGNICRSPTAEGVFRRFVDLAQAGDRVRIDSAGTHDYHVGEPPDKRSQLAALRRGYDLSAQRARRVLVDDFREFDLLIAMDRGHFAILQQMAADPGYRVKVKRMLDYGTRAPGKDVPDPYYGGPEGFELVLDLLEDACSGLLRHVEREIAGR